MLALGMVMGGSSTQEVNRGARREGGGGGLASKATEQASGLSEPARAGPPTRTLGASHGPLWGRAGEGEGSDPARGDGTS